MKEQILSYLSRDYPWTQQFEVLEEVGSTNDLLKTLAAQGAPHGTVRIAHRQTGGRGRLGRSFHSPPGMGIYLSILLRPNCPAGELMHLTCAAAVAMGNAVEQAVGLRPGIKWTNDLVFPPKKLGGILTEMSLTPRGAVDYAIVGIGLNCCQQAEDFPEELRATATSLAMATGQPICRPQVAAAMMDALADMDASLLTQKASMLECYRRDCVTIGREISVLRGQEVLHGTALDVDDQGALVVRFSDGVIRPVNSGEVSIRGMYGYI